MSAQSGDIPNTSVTETWAALTNTPTAQLIDVRTQAEWSFVGIPDLAGIGKQVILLEWQVFPHNNVNPSFADTLASELERRGTSPPNELYFLCRSGVRSLAAAQVMAEQGYTACHNVAHGFEGPLDANRHRGSTAGWKADGLPWAQG